MALWLGRGKNKQANNQKGKSWIKYTHNQKNDSKNNKNKYYIYDNSTDDKSLEEKILKVVLSKLK